MYDEGVIKFQAQHSHAPLSWSRFGDVACKLIAWREILSKLQLVGQDPERYGGAGYGNVSARVGPASVRGKRAMLISGTQTGGLRRMELGHLAFVKRYDYERNQVVSEGQVQPSSETMTHGAIYDLSPAIRFVFHAHSPVLWRNAAALRIPTSDPRVPYGTPQMAREVLRLHASTALPSKRILAMGGHEDGIVVFGQSAEEAGEAMVRYLAKAFERSCGVGLRGD